MLSSKIKQCKMQQDHKSVVSLKNWLFIPANLSLGLANLLSNRDKGSESNMKKLLNNKEISIILTQTFQQSCLAISIIEGESNCVCTQDSYQMTPNS